jgi:hypothetical protein
MTIPVDFVAGVFGGLLVGGIFVGFSRFRQAPLQLHSKKTFCNDSSKDEGQTKLENMTSEQIEMPSLSAGSGSLQFQSLDTIEVERLLGERFGQYFIPLRLEKELPNGSHRQFENRNDVLRYRQWLPPVVVYAEQGASKIEVIITPSAMDAMLSTILSINDARYYRVYKDLAFTLCQRLSKKMDLYLSERGGTYNQFPIFTIKFDRKGFPISEKFSSIIMKGGYGIPKSYGSSEQKGLMGSLSENGILKALSDE